jgi:hypothetical protein
MFETTANVWHYVIGAYSVTWLGLIAYTVRLYVLNRRAVEVAAEVGGDT